MEGNGPIPLEAGPGVPAGRVRRLLEKFLRCGLSPRRMALTLALGVTIGILPVVWGATLLCSLAALFFRLNQAGIQAVNYLAYPLQLALFVPFFRMGEKLFPGLTVTSKGHGGPFCAFLARAGASNIKAIGAWCVVAPPLAVILFGVSLPIFSARMGKQSFPKGEIP